MDKSILKLIANALKEDVKNGDITTKATISKSKKAIGKFLVKADGIIAGLEIAKAVFKSVDPKIKFEIIFLPSQSWAKGKIYNPREIKLLYIHTKNISY